MANIDILPTRNEAWGFWGTMGAEARAAWPIAFRAIAEATGCDADEVRAFLDSRGGRHFADEVANQRFSGATLQAGIAGAVAVHMRWRISRATSRETGIPAGLPYLTGFVVHEGIAARAAAEG